MQPKRRLCAVLACPPTTSGNRTLNALAVAAGCLELPDVAVVNLLGATASNTAAMSLVGAAGDVWHSSRPALEHGVRRADALIAAWGVQPLGGQARQHHRDQVAWLVQTAEDAGHDSAWTVGGQPRHPSRWHQFASDRHGRTAPGLSREERIRGLLTLVPLRDLLAPSA